MNEDRVDGRTAISASLARLESWFSSVRDEDGYYGPSIGANGWTMAFCGPAFDWRYEGILRAYASRYEATGKSVYRDFIEQDVEAIVRAQWRNGCFSVSHFENNPCEGGMPHEPAMLSGVCRVIPFLETWGYAGLSRAYDAVEKYITEYLIRQLWNKTLRTFNCWPTSDFVSYNPHCVASVLELLIRYAALTDSWNRFESYIVESGRSILAVQIAEGPLRGGIPATSNERDRVYPYWAVRCLPAIRLLAAKTQCPDYIAALSLMKGFLSPWSADVTAYPHVLWADRPPRALPFLVGAGADSIMRLLDAELMDREEALRQAQRLLPYQLPTGAFRTAVGFGGRKRTCDWRDIVPVCGWLDKIYALSSLLCSGDVPDVEPAGPFETDVRVVWRPVRFRETRDEMVMEKRNGTKVYHWVKRTRWPLVCLL